jgi:hypothetical protein
VVSAHRNFRIGTRSTVSTAVDALPFDDRTFALIREAFALPDNVLSMIEEDNEVMTYFWSSKPGLAVPCLSKSVNQQEEREDR